MRTARIVACLGEERIPESEIAQISSKSLRIAMATLMKRKGVSEDEIVEMGQWEKAPHTAILTSYGFMNFS